MLRRSPLFDPQRKPEFGTVVVNRDHPLSVGLIGCFLFNERSGYIQTNLARGAYVHSAGIPSQSANVKYVPGLYGTSALDFNGSQTSSTQVPQIPALSLFQLNRNSLTVLARVKLRGAGTTRQIVECNANSGWRLRVDSSNLVSAVMNPGPLVVVGATTVTADRVHDVGVTTTNTGDGNGTRVFLDGKQDGSSGTVSTGSGSAQTVYLGRSNTFANEEFNGFIEHLYIWDRHLRNTEIQGLWHQPYSFFRPIAAGFTETLEGATISAAGIVLTGDLTTAINMEGAIPTNVTLSGALTTQILMQATINVDVGLQGPLFTAKMGHRLKACGHPMFTKCERLHLGEES